MEEKIYSAAASSSNEKSNTIPPLDQNLLPTSNEPEPVEPDYSKPETYAERVTSENMIDAIIKTQDLG